MSFLSKLFGGNGRKPARVEPELYQGFSITPQPAPAEGGYRIGALIEKGDKRHELIRADVIGDEAGAREASLIKARQMIDQMGERLF